MLRLFLVLTIVTGIVYPMIVTGIGSVIFPFEANGSLIKLDGDYVGSELIGQKFSADRYFHSRPSATGYMTIGTGATHASPTNETLKNEIEKRKSLSPSADVDFWTSSGSGLDPHISLKTALSQVQRVAAARMLPPSDIEMMIKNNLEGSTLGIWGQSRVNVLKLNISLDTQGANGNTR